MERTNIKLHIDDLVQTYEELQNNEMPEGMAKKGFSIDSPDKNYVISFWMYPDGYIELIVREPFGSYAAMEKLTYQEIKEKQNVDYSGD